MANETTYSVKGTDLEITVEHTSMAHGSDNKKGNDFAFLMMDVVVSREGKRSRLSLTEGRLRVWEGFNIKISSLGFSYSTGGGTLVIDRVK